ncbi:MAG: peptidylprolyl isomerase [Thermodesulfobacteriota bacterium]
MAQVSGSNPTQPAAPRPTVVLETSEGRIVIELMPDKAPVTVKNFLAYVNSGYYDGTIFHRVIPNFMIQGGGLGTDMAPRPGAKRPIANEADNGLKNDRGTVAMARTADPHSATSQFFINSVNNASLDHRGKSPAGWGYAVFGRVTDGMDVVDAISKTPTGTRGPFQNVPVKPVVIQKAKVLE